MDSIDQALLEAWKRVSQQLRNDPAEAARRFARLKLKTMQRPVRPWCLRLRASDTRINRFWIVAPELAPKGKPPPKYPPHQVGIDGDSLRTLMRPVKIDWPGLDWTDAAAMLGRHPESIRGWIKRGLFKVTRYSARSVRKIGHPVPFIWTHSPIDPNAEGGPPKSRSNEWGESWMNLFQKIPEDFGQIFRREPIFRTVGKDKTPRFRGWHFVCRGRMLRVDQAAAETLLHLHRKKNPHATLILRNNRLYIHLPCEKRTDSLLCPLPVWTIPNWLHDHRPMVVGEDDIAGIPMPRVHVPGAHDTVLPGIEDWSKDMVARAFACHRCWQVRYCSLIDRNGWNLLVSHLSGGLLRGQDVPRPSDLSPTRLRAYRMNGPVRVVPIPPATTARRERVLALLLQGHTYQQIADTLHTSYITTREDVRVVYKSHRVKTRKQLLHKLQSTTPMAA